MIWAGLLEVGGKGKEGKVNCEVLILRNLAEAALELLLQPQKIVSVVEGLWGEHAQMQSPRIEDFALLSKRRERLSYKEEQGEILHKLHSRHDGRVAVDLEFDKFVFAGRHAMDQIDVPVSIPT